MRKDHTQLGEHSDRSDKGEVASDVLEKTLEFSENWNKKEEERVIHCSKCHNAEQSEKYMKAATIFSLGAFVFSIVSLALPFLRNVDTDQWEQVLNTLETIQEAVVKAPPAPAAPTTQKTSSKPTQAAAVQSSSAVSSREAASSSAEPSSSAAQEASSSSMADGTGL